MREMMREMMRETWRPIEGYEGLYEVSDQGTVRSLDGSGRILKPGNNGPYEQFNGGRTVAILYSIMASTKANQAESFRYVRDSLVRFADKPTEALSQLLPDQWLKTHPESRGRWSRWMLEFP